MATVQRYVNTASSGGDGTTNNTSGATAAYASLQSWEANTGGSATDDYIVDCCGTIVDSTPLAVNFATDITTGSILIRGNRSDPAGFYEGDETIHPSYYRLAVGNSGFSVISCEEHNLTIDGIQVTYGQTGSFATAVAFTNKSVAVRKCRILNTGSCFNGIGADNASSGSVTRLVENNLVVGFSQHQIKMLISTNWSPTHTIRHNTCYGTNAGSGVGIKTDRGGGTSNPTIVVSGNAVANHAGNDIDTSGTLGSYTAADNATEDTTGQVTGISPAAAWTSPSPTASNGKFTIKDTNSPLYQIVNPTLVTDDIVGFTRDDTNHDAGAFEFQPPDEFQLTTQLATFAQGIESPGISVSL